jgi:integrase
MEGKMKKTGYVGIYQRKLESLYKPTRGKPKPDSAFYATYRVDDKKVWEKIGKESEGYSALLASQIRAEHIRLKRHGEELPRERRKAPLLKDVWVKYAEWVKQNRKNKGIDDVSRYQNYLGPALETKRLDEISPLDLERLKSNLGKEGLAPASVKHVLVLFRQIYNRALMWGLHKGENPIKQVKITGPNNQRERFLSFEEAETLLNELSQVSPLLHDIALLSLHTGMRAGEIFNLKGHDLDFGNRFISIADPKSGESRKAYMTDESLEILRKRSPANPSDYVFRDRWHQGKIQGVSKAFAKTVDKLGFNRGVEDRRQQVCFHSLRHTFASWLALQGESIKTLQELLGHKTMAMTSRYSHLTPDHRRDAVKRLEQVFKDTKTRKVEKVLE